MNPTIPEQLKEANIIPIRAGEKIPACSWGDYQLARYPREKLTLWKGNFAVICGSISNHLVVIDFDSPELYKRFFSDIDTFTVRTPSGGYHLYFYDASLERKFPRYRGFPIDVQGEGSYVLIPPSEINGVRYEVVRNTEIQTADVQKLLDERLPRVERPTDIEEFKRNINISTVIERYVKKMRQGRRYWSGICPFHNDHRPSFTVYDDHFYCFGCGEHGDVISFVQKIEKKSFTEAVDQLSAEFGVPSPLKRRDHVLFDEDGKADMFAFAQALDSEFHFICPRDTEELYIYIDGYYHLGGETYIRAWIRRQFEKAGKVAPQPLISNLIDEMKARHYIEREQFNPHGYLCLRNGILDLETLQIRPHTPQLYFTYQLPVEYEPNADCPRFKQFLREIFDEQEKRRLVQEMFGYCLQRGNPHHKAFMLVGSGSNGKTTLLETLRALLGAKNTTSFSLQDLNSENCIRAELEGKLANICSDNPSKALYDTEPFKRLTGGDAISARRLYQRPFSFYFEGKAIFAANKLPRTSDDTPAFWRRWIIIKFEKSFLGREDKQLLQKLTSELSGILNFALEGLKRLRERGDFEIKETLADAAEFWRKQSDSLYWFVSERVRERTGAVVSKADFYAEYVRFCEERDTKTLSKTEVGHKLPQYCPLARSERKWLAGRTQACWVNIELVEEQEEQSEQPGGGHDDEPDWFEMKRTRIYDEPKFLK
ncbi:MAG: bifunctional DNA primase/polymerase [Deltaproteobacteria bacterium]|nr:bifunctional DNA primase/polymerase [Deltaproteobacteria bacterium]